MSSVFLRFQECHKLTKLCWLIYWKLSRIPRKFATNDGSFTNHVAFFPRFSSHFLPPFFIQKGKLYGSSDSPSSFTYEVIWQRSLWRFCQIKFYFTFSELLSCISNIRSIKVLNLQMSHDISIQFTYRFYSYTKINIWIDSRILRQKIIVKHLNIN